MVKVKVSSNPYQKEILFDKWNNQAGVWKSISYQNNENSKLISDKMKRSFLPFTVKEIIDIIIENPKTASTIIKDLFFKIFLYSPDTKISVSIARDTTTNKA